MGCGILPGLIGLVELMTNRDKYAEKSLIVKGIPISSHCVGYGDSGNSVISIVLRDNEGNAVLCYNRSGNISGHVQAKTLIDAEINDKDEEQITLRGKFSESGIFNADSVRVLKYDINLNTGL